MSGIDRLSSVVSEVQDRQRGQLGATMSQRRARFVDQVVHEPTPRRWSRVVAFAGFAMAAAVALLIVAWPGTRADRAVDFTVASVHGVPGEWISAGTVDVDVAFSDGTVLAVLAGGKARIDPTPRGARVVLESGAVKLDVEPLEDSSWRVDAGPFTVAVAGTAFRVDWDPNESDLRVVVNEGTVAVEGPIWSAVQYVTAGQAIEARLPDVEVTRIEDPEATEEIDETTAPDQPRARPTPRRAGPDWKALAGGGDHRAAIDAAEAAGFDALCRKLPAGELLSLGESARYARSPARAEQALKAVRKRFAQTPAAANAAYNLGLVAFDQRRAYGKAGAWFKAYLKEQPRGALAREAMGRQMESYKRAGDEAKARAVAEVYTDRYPSGPHADLAKKLRMQ